jgi:hypothetical protein
MKSDLISALPIVPEKYEVSHYDEIDYQELHSEMAIIERKFINGLIRWYQPRNILEIGVCAGGGSVNILNAIRDMPDSSLTSIDCVDFYWHDRSRPVGFDVWTAFPGGPFNEWNLIMGKDLSEVIEGLGKTFDFVVIDSSHQHPIETINFLCALPYLKDGSIVVLQDTTLYAINDMLWGFAPRILMCSVAAEKLLPREGYTFREDDDPLHNIVAFQVTADTRKYIGNLFQALMLPWETNMLHSGYFKSVRSLLDKHYSAEQMEAFDRGTEMNSVWFTSGKLTFSSERAYILHTFTKLKNRKVIFYGAGKNMCSLLKLLQTAKVPFDFPIWDINADKIGQIYGAEITKPDFITCASASSPVVITISNHKIASSVAERLEELGYEVYYSLLDYVRSLSEESR